MAATLAILLTLIWNRSPDPDVGGYWLYQGGQSGRYTNVMDLGNMASASVAGMVVGATNYFAVRAYSQAGGGSELSREYRWPEAIVPPIVATGLCEGIITLSWSCAPGQVYRVVGNSNPDIQWFGWMDLTGDLEAAGDSLEWSEPATEPEKLYRVVRIK